MRLRPKLAGMDGWMDGCLRRSPIRQNPQIHREGCLGAFGELSLSRTAHSAHTAVAVRLVRAEIT